MKDANGLSSNKIPRAGDKSPARSTKAKKEMNTPRKKTRASPADLKPPASRVKILPAGETAKEEKELEESKFTFSSLYVSELRNLYDAEKQQIEFLDDIKEAAVTPELKKILVQHIEQKNTQIGRLENIFQTMGEEPAGVFCEAMESFIREIEEVISLIPKSEIKDAALIAALQRIKHYDMACYGTAKTFARHLNYEEASELLDTSLKEEDDTDKKLSSVAEGGFFTTGVNKIASRLKAPIK